MFKRTPIDVTISGPKFNTSLRLYAIGEQIVGGTGETLTQVVASPVQLVTTLIELTRQKQLAEDAL